MDQGDGQQVERGHKTALELVGPYTLIAQIAGGDFTSVHLAQKQGALGFHRLSAIKRLKRDFARQPEWTQLLLDEARLSAAVRHVNIVDVIDVGNDPEVGVYIVMDYIEGADLDILIERAGKERHPRYLVPPIVDALTGLHAMHTAHDELGESLSMVHQAPRARHILIGIDGVSRITDFSQAAARGLIPSTLRSKRLAASYMAPEQVLVSDPVSPRTDVFIAGITLWETLTGTRLFHADTPSLARRAVTERHIPRPSELGLRPPSCFDDICMQALQRNPEQRYETAADMARELRDAAQNEGLYANSSELGQWVRALASRALVERRRALGADAPSQEILLDAPPPASKVSVSFAKTLVGSRAAEPPSHSQVSRVPVPSAQERASSPMVSTQLEAPGATFSSSSPGASLLRTTQLDTPKFKPKAGSSSLMRTTLLDAPAKPQEVQIVQTAPSVMPSVIIDAPRGAQTYSVSTGAGPRPSLRGSRSSLSKSTLLGVSGTPRSSKIPPPALAATMGYGSATQQRLSDSRDGSEAQVMPGRRPAGTMPPNATLPEGAFLRDLHVPSTPPSRRLASGAAAAGIADAFASDPHHARALHTESSTTPLPPVDSDQYPTPGSGAFRTPAVGLPASGARGHGPARFGALDFRSRPDAHAGEGSAAPELFARLQAARHDAGDSYRPPAYSNANPGEDWDDEPPAPRAMRLTSLLLVGAVLVAGFVGYRHMTAEPIIVRSPASEQPFDPEQVDPALEGEGESDLPQPVDPNDLSNYMGEPELPPDPAAVAPTPDLVAPEPAPPEPAQLAPAPAPRAANPARAARPQLAQPVAPRQPAPAAAAPRKRPAPAFSRPQAAPRAAPARHREESLPDNPY